MQEKRQITANHNWLILYTGEHGDKDLQLTDNADRVEISVYVSRTFIGKQLTPSQAYEVSAWLHRWANEHGHPGDHSDTCDRITELHSEYSADVAAMQLRAEAAEAALESLTPGGSEFHANPARCVEWVRERLQGVAAQVEKRKAAEQRAEAAEAALAAADKYGSYCIVTWWASINNSNIAIKSFAEWYAQERQEVQPCPKCKGTGYRYNRYGEMAECMDCDARGEVQP